MMDGVYGSEDARTPRGELSMPLVLDEIMFYRVNTLYGWQVGKDDVIGGDPNDRACERIMLVSLEIKIIVTGIG